MGHSKLTWADLYFDGIIDEKYEGFDEDSQEVFDLHQVEEEYIEDFKDEDAYWASQDTLDDRYIKLSQERLK
jgi:hypothetical protein